MGALLQPESQLVDEWRNFALSLSKKLGLCSATSQGGAHDVTMGVAQIGVEHEPVGQEPPWDPIPTVVVTNKKTTFTRLFLRNLRDLNRSPLDSLSRSIQGCMVTVPTPVSGRPHPLGLTHSVTSPNDRLPSSAP